MDKTSLWLRILLLVLITAAVCGVVGLTKWVTDKNTRANLAIAAGKADREKFYAASPSEQREMLSGKDEDYSYGLGFTYYPGAIYKDSDGNLWMKDVRLNRWNNLPDLIKGPYEGQHVKHH